MMETDVKSFIERSGSGAYPSSDKDLDSFDKVALRLCHLFLSTLFLIREV